MQNSSPKERLIEFAKSVNLGQTAFETKVGLSRGAISKMTDNSSITSKVLEKIIKHYPEANRIWLLTGDSEKFKPSQAESKNYSQKTTETKTAETEQDIATESYKERYYRQLEENNKLLREQIQTQQLIQKVQKSLDEVLENQLTMTSMAQAMQDVLFKFLSPDKHASLQETVHNKGVKLMRAVKKKGNGVQNDR